MSKKLINVPLISKMSDTNSIFGNFGGACKQISLADFRKALNENDEEVLSNLAFYIDVNKASASGSTRVDVGGNLNMLHLWESASFSILMDANGNYTELNRNDARYTADGVYLLNADGTVISDFAHCDFMKVIPQHYGRIQTVTIGSTSIERLWLSMVPLPGGYIIPQQVVGKFKLNLASNVARSIPGVIPSGNNTVYSFWTKAQSRSKQHGLAGLEFRNHLLFHMMAKYGYRDCQNAVGQDSTKIWGVGLDGTENTTSSAASGFDRQKNIKTGATLSLGDYDGNIAETDSEGGTCHSVSVSGFENPWGQYWEMLQGLCSVGTDVYFWRSNFMPASSTPTAETFANVEHVKLTRPTSAVWGMNIIASQQGQGCYMIPKQSIAGISYGDNFWYAANGQLWLFGGTSSVGANCGLASANSNDAWTYSDAYRSARLAFYGTLNRVSTEQLRNAA